MVESVILWMGELCVPAGMALKVKYRLTDLQESKWIYDKMAKICTSSLTLLLGKALRF